MGCSASVDVKETPSPETHANIAPNEKNYTKTSTDVVNNEKDEGKKGISTEVNENDKKLISAKNSTDENNKDDNGYKNTPLNSNTQQEPSEVRARNNGANNKYEKKIETPPPMTEEQKVLDKALQDLRHSLFSSGIIPSNDHSESTLHGTIVGIPTITIDTVSFKAAVVDAGSGFCKAGLTGDDIPSVVIPTVVGRLRDNIASSETFIGKDAKLRKDALKYSCPIQRGVVEDWEDMEKVYDHIFHMDLNLEPTEYGVVLPESPLSDRKRREKLTELMMEKLKVKQLYLGSSATLAMHALGFSTGLFISLGHGVCHSVPVVQGNIIDHAVRTTRIGNKDVINKMQEMLIYKQNYGNVDEDIARAMVEKMCYVCPDYEEIMKDRKLNTEKSYTLPNGKSVDLKDERFVCPEVFFKPNIIQGCTESSLSEICLSSLKSIDDQKSVADLRRNIILAGGPSLLPGVGERLKIDLTKNEIANDQTNVLLLPKRQYAEWRGASMQVSMSSSKNRWIDHELYEEHGSSIIHRKYV